VGKADYEKVAMGMTFSALEREAMQKRATARLSVRIRECRSVTLKASSVSGCASVSIEG
jgi:hypothetical protein